MQGYKEMFIKDLNKEEIKIAISGIIINKDNNHLIIDDTTGTIKVNIETDLSINNFVRVFGNLIFYNEDKEIQGHLIQDLNQVNKKLYQKVKALLN